MLGGLLDNLTGNKNARLKGTVVLMRKNVLDLNDFSATVIDGISEFLGKGVTCQLVSSTVVDTNNGNRGKVGAEANLEQWLTSLPSLTTGESKFGVTFEWEVEKLGVPGAIIVKNYHNAEFLLKTITLDNVPGRGTVSFVANSWVYPVAKYRYNRVFFSNDAVGLRIIQSVEDVNPTVVPTESCPEALEEDDLPQVEETGCLQIKAADAVSPQAVVHDPPVVTETTALEVDEAISSDLRIRDNVSDQLVETFASDLMLEDVRGTTNPTGPEPVKSVEKKRKASATEFTSMRYKVKTKKSTRSSGVPVVSDQDTPQERDPVDEVIEEVLDQIAPQARVAKVVETAPEQVAPTPASAQDPLVILTPSAEVDIPGISQQVPPPVGNSPQSNKFPFHPRFIENKELDEAWGKVSDRQAMIGPDTIFAEYNDLAIRQFVENFAVVGGLTQRIRLLEEKHSELKNLERIKENVVAKEAIIAKLQEEIQNKDRSIEYVTTRQKEVFDSCEKKLKEKDQALERVGKVLEFERGKEADLMLSLDEKIRALNKMIFDMGSGSSLPTLREPTEKINYLGKLLEDLKGLLKTTRENHAQTMKEAAATGVSVVLAKLKASDPSIHLKAVEEDFDCSGDEATKLIEEMKPLGDKVAEEMEVGSPSHSTQSGGSTK